MRRGYDFSFTVGSHILRSQRLRISCSTLGWVRRLGAVSRPGLPGKVCAFQSVMACISAAQRIGGDLIVGYLLPFVAAEGGRGRLSLSLSLSLYLSLSLSLCAARMIANLQTDLRRAEPPNHITTM